MRKYFPTDFDSFPAFQFLDSKESKTPIDGVHFSSLDSKKAFINSFFDHVIKFPRAFQNDLITINGKEGSSWAAIAAAGCGVVIQIFKNRMGFYHLIIVDDDRELNFKQVGASVNMGHAPGQFIKAIEKFRNTLSSQGILKRNDLRYDIRQEIINTNVKFDKFFPGLFERLTKKVCITRFKALELNDYFKIVVSSSLKRDDIIDVDVEISYQPGWVVASALPTLYREEDCVHSRCVHFTYRKGDGKSERNARLINAISNLLIE